MSNGYRTLSQHLNDLKKENFSLKLRIYFLEERMQQKYEASRDDIYKRVSAGAARSSRPGAGGPPTALQIFLPPAGRANEGGRRVPRQVWPPEREVTLDQPISPLLCLFCTFLVVKRGNRSLLRGGTVQNNHFGSWFTV